MKDYRVIHSHLFIIAALTIALLGCALEDEESFSEVEYPILNGLVDPGHPSVVRVFAEGVTNPTPTTPACTGVLIYHNTVLTAAHCVTPGATHLVLFDGGSGFVGIATRHHAYVAISSGAPNDLAVVKTSDKMARPFYAKIAQNVAPNMPITLVGYGQTGANIAQDGIKRFGTNIIDSVDNNFFYFNTALNSPAGEEAATCRGDSGGPAFLGGVNSDCVGGVTEGVPPPTSAGSACAAHPEGWYHTRVDTKDNFLFIKSQALVETCTY